MSLKTEDYECHIKMHDEIITKKLQQFSELENRVFNHLLKHFLDEVHVLVACALCEFRIKSEEYRLFSHAVNRPTDKYMCHHKNIVYGQRG